LLNRKAREHQSDNRQPPRGEGWKTPTPVDRQYQAPVMVENVSLMAEAIKRIVRSGSANSKKMFGRF